MSTLSFKPEIVINNIKFNDISDVKQALVDLYARRDKSRERINAVIISIYAELDPIVEEDAALSDISDELDILEELNKKINEYELLKDHLEKSDDYILE